jgi:hypothetical protein
MTSNEPLEGEPNGSSPSGAVACCDKCGHPLDDIEAMGEAALLGYLRVHALRGLARTAKDGTLSHQELTIIRGLLRDNNRALKDLKPDEPKDPAMPPQGTTPLSSRRVRPDFPPEG